MGILQELVVKITGETAGLDKSISGSDKKVADFAKKLGDLGKKMTMFVTLPILGAGVAALKAAADFEKHRVSFETMMGSAAKAQVLLKQIQDFSATTPFQLPGLIQGSKRLLAFGIAAEDIVETMRRLGNAAQGDQAILDRLTLAFGKLRAKGRATMEELNMFTEAGVPIMDALAERYEVTTGELFKLVETGKVGFEDVNAALTDLTTGAGMFAGLIEKQAGTLSGLISTLKDNIGLLAKEFGNILLPDIKRIVSWMTDLVRSLQAMDARQKNLIITIAKMAAAIGPLMIAISALNKVVGMNPYVAIAGAIALIVTGLIAWRRAAKDVKGEQEEMREGIEETTASIEEQNLELASNTLQQIRNERALLRRRLESAKTVKEGWVTADAIAEMTRRFRELGEEYEVAIVAYREAQRALRDLAGSTGEVVVETGELTQGQKDYIEANAELLAQFKLIEARYDALGDEVDRQAEKKQVLIEVIEDLIEKGYRAEGDNIQTLLRDYGDLLKAEDEVIAAVDEVASVREEYGRQALLELETRQWVEEMKRKAIEETLEEQRQSLQEVLSFISTLAGSIGDIVQSSHDRQLQASAEYYDEEQGRLDDWYEAERAKLGFSAEAELQRAKDAIDANNSMTEVEKQNAKDLLDLDIELAEQQKELDEEREARQRQLEYDAAKRSKAFAVFQAALDIPMAVLAALRTPGLISRAAAIAFAITTGAAQLAAILAQPLPALEEGGFFRGPAIVGEGGVPEFALPLRDDVMNRLAEAIMRQPAIQNTFSPVDQRPLNVSLSIDGKKLDAHIQRALDNRMILVGSGSMK